MTPTDLLAPTYIQMLTALSAWLSKARAQMQTDADLLLAERLAPDMFPLSTQIRFACVQALEGMHRLRDEEFPSIITDLLEEGRNAENSSDTIANTQGRIDQTIASVRSLAEGTASIDPDRAVAHDLPNGMVFDLTLDQYSRDWAIGQFYFHVMIAYAILRYCHVDLGKADYVAHMFAHLRPGTMPQS